MSMRMIMVRPFYQGDAPEGRGGSEPIPITLYVTMWELDLQACYLSHTRDLTKGRYLTHFLCILHPAEMYLANF